MCGIVGYYHASGLDESFLDKANQTLKHRGPDQKGFRQFRETSVGMAHSRLSIIDLSSAGIQPMSNADRSIWVTFNGEIYNYRSLRTELELKGYKFVTQTDTEVLVHGFEEWGKLLLPRLNGMFAFCIWDENSSTLVMARDRFGIKPLIYYYDGHSLIFGSELKSIISFPFFIKKINPKAINSYLNYYSIPAPDTIWENTKKLLPGHCLSFKLGSIPLIEEYWAINPGAIKTSAPDAYEEAWHLLKKSVLRNLESDVPVGLFLSSGYDSSSLLILMRELGLDVNTYTIGFEASPKTEHIESKQIANLLGSNHREEVLQGNFMSVIDKLTDFYDEPCAITSMVSYFYVSKLAAKFNKVVLAGDGGDEVFGGYKWYSEVFSAFKSRGIIQRLRHLNLEKKKDFYYRHYFRHMGANPAWTKQVLTDQMVNGFEPDIYAPFHLPEHYWNLHPTKVMQLLDFKMFMPDVNLLRADMSSMANSLEVRVPFLDNDLVDFMISLDPTVYFKYPIKKYFLREKLKSILPQSILNLPKKGFGNPLNSFYDNKHLYVNALSDDLFVEAGIIKPGIQYHKLDKRQLWLLYGLHQWVKKWAL